MAGFSRVVNAEVMNNLFTTSQLLRRCAPKGARTNSPLFVDKFLSIGRGDDGVGILMHLHDDDDYLIPRLLLRDKAGG